MAEPTTKGIKLQDLYEAGWEIRIDDVPVDEQLRTMFGAPAFGAHVEQRVVIARGDQVAIEWRMRNMEVNGDSILELIEAIDQAKAARR